MTLRRVESLSFLFLLILVNLFPCHCTNLQQPALDTTTTATTPSSSSLSSIHANVSKSKRSNMNISPPPLSSSESLPKEKVCIIGSGNWASAIAIIIGQNCKRLPFCDSNVNMYVHEELIDVPIIENSNNHETTQMKLSHYINTHHQNIKYLPNIQLPSNIIADPHLLHAIQDATLLIFCLPHQFLKPILKSIQDNSHLLSSGGCRGVSLIKGMDYDPIHKRPILISKYIQDALNEYGHQQKQQQNNRVNPFACGVLMGANVANGVAKGQICESTLATNYDTAALNHATLQIFNSPNFRVYHTNDIYGTEACGALKNIIALGCGFLDSVYYDKDNVNEGSNTKAALIRIGLLEMKRFCKMFFNFVEDDTFDHSCGIADLITTCYSGRNHACSKEFGNQQRREMQRHVGINCSNDWNAEKCAMEWSRIEQALLNGQKLQGTLTCQEAYMILSSRKLLHLFPLMNVIYEIAFEGKPIGCIVNGIVAPHGVVGSNDICSSGGDMSYRNRSIQSKL